MRAPSSPGGEICARLETDAAKINRHKRQHLQFTSSVFKNLRIQVLNNPIPDRRECLNERLLIFLEQRDPEALQLRAERRDRNYTYTFSAQQVVYKTLVIRYLLVYPSLHQCVHLRIVDPDLLVRLERAITENDRIIKCPECFIERELGHGTQYIRNDFAAAPDILVRLCPIRLETRITQHTRYRELRQLRRAHLDHLGIVERITEPVEVFVLVAVVIFHP